MNTEGSGGFNLHDLLEKELRRRLGTVEGPCPEASQSAYHAAFLAGRTAVSSSSPPAAFAFTKIAAALLAVALVIVGGSAFASASSGRANPAAWGKTVTAAVTNCMDRLKGEQHGIGQCVSAVAKQHGEEERTSHSASGARANPPGSAPGENGLTGAPTDQQTGQPENRSTRQPKNDHDSTGQPKSHPTGPPNGVPAGPPANRTPASGGPHSTRAPASPPPHP